MKKVKKIDVNGNVGFNFKVNAELLAKFQILAMQQSINTNEKHTATSLMTDLMTLAVGKPEILNQITVGENHE